MLMDDGGKFPWVWWAAITTLINQKDAGELTKITPFLKIKVHMNCLPSAKAKDAD